MTLLRRLAALALVLCASAAAAQGGAAPPPGPAAQGARVRIRRFALLVGTNDGGEGRLRLRYAVSDAQSVARVLDELGGVAPEDHMLLVEAGRADFEKALGRLRSQVAAAGRDVRTEALVYYSGHADEEGLLLKGERLAYRELRRALEALPADVRIAIVDSCASGAFARTKGGARKPAFLVDTSSSVRGHAILTSSSEDEVSQESDRIGGSYFTHHLVSGLRGAADLSRDGRVTLNEAYHFAFAETLERTERTQAGPQHPAYDIQLAGSGDLVMTDLRATSAGLVLAESLEGRMSIRDAQGVLVMELAKAAGRPTELALAPGRYSVQREASGGHARAEVVLAHGRRTSLTPDAFSVVAGEPVAVRGGAASGALPTGTVSEGAVLPVTGAAVGVPVAVVPAPVTELQWRMVGVNVGIVPGMDINGLFMGPVENAFSLGLISARSQRLRGMALALGGNWTDGETLGLQVALGTNMSGAGLTGAQVSLVGNTSTGPLLGLQAALGVNVARGQVRGFQGTLGMNTAGGDMGGLQAALAANITTGNMAVSQLALGANVVGKDVTGLQAAVGANIVGQSVTGLQGAVGGNWAHAGVRGVQLSVGINVTGQHLEGLQSTVGTNWALGGVSGAQLAAGLNVAGRMRGAQVAVVNLGGDVTGVQVGLLNIARRVSGMQVGLVNVSEEMNGLPVGLLSLARNTEVHLGAFASDIHPANVALKVRTGMMYALAQVGAAVPKSEGGSYLAGLGLGVHVPVGAFFVEGELSGGTFIRYGHSRDVSSVVRTATLFGWQVRPRFALVAGLTYNWQRPYKGTPEPMSFIPARGSGALRHWPGFNVGVQL